MTQTLKTIRGMNDILPDESAHWLWFEDCVRSVLESYGYSQLRTPLIEPTELFTGSIGETTDVIEKEMYTFESRGGSSLSLRPEGTASLVRSALQHGLIRAQQVKLWYSGPMFRYEKPQRGRYRQFHQIGAEAYAQEGPDIDCELLLMGERIWKTIGLGGIFLEINSLGDAQCRQLYRGQLTDYLQDHRANLDEDSQRRLQANPLRILDSKNPDMAQIIELAPKPIDYLTEAAKEHFDTLCRYLDNAGLTYRVNPRLVRGLDYYSRTVFEWVSGELGAQAAVCSGGRYDGLFEKQGGKPTPAIGWAMGVERILELLTIQNKRVASTKPHVYMVLAGENAIEKGLILAEHARNLKPGIRIRSNLGGGSFKAQFKRADRCEAEFAWVLGEDEIASQSVVVKYLRDKDVAQCTLNVAELGNWIEKNIEL